MEKLKSIEITQIKVKAKSGKTLNICLREGMVLAIELEKPVLLLHNKTTFIIDPDKMYKTIR